MSHTPFQYVPGRATALASASVGVLLGVDAEHPAVDGLLEALDDGAGVDDVLDLLLRGGVRGLPDFACAEVMDAGLRVVVRGAFMATPDAGDPLRATSGPWVDVVVTAASVVLRGPEAASSRRMPFHGGVVLADELVVAATNARPVHAVGLQVRAPVTPVDAVAGVPAGAAASDVTQVPDEPPAAEVHDRPLVPDAPPEVATPNVATPDVATDEVATPDVATDEVATPDVATPDVAADEVAPGTLTPADRPVDAAGEQLLDFDFLFASPPPTWAPERNDPIAAEPPAVEPPPADPIPADPAMTSPSVVTASLPLPLPPEAPVSVGGLIQGLPWEQPPGDGASGAPASVGAVGGFRPAEGFPPAVVAPAAALPLEVREPVAAQPEVEQPGVHDDLSSRTINRSQLQGLGAAPQTVLAVRCTHGHLSPAFAAVCRVCRTPVSPQQHFETSRPTLGVLRLSTGAVVTLDRGAILGRNPRVPADHQGAQPNLVRVVDPGRDLSGQHLEVALDFWNVVVRDLGSTNGTEVVLPGETPVALPPNQPMILEPGSKVVMAGTVSFVFEATP